MTSLFSSFDFYFFYLSMVFVLLLFSYALCLFSPFSLFFFSLNLIASSLESFYNSLKQLPFNKCSTLLSISMIFLIFFLNFSSVFPFTFPFTSGFGPILFFSLTVWSSFMLFYLVSNFKGCASHFIPEGTPIYLTWFLFFVELISSIIRPLTLSVRLFANILAGHLLMILLSKLVFLFNMFFPLYILLNLVELFVSLIQSYILTTMVVLYYTDLS